MVICSCTTVNNLLQPEWTLATPKVSGAVMYVGHGTGFTEGSAKDRAYQNILDKIGKDLGYEISNQYFRQLIATDSIPSLSTTITDYYVYQQADGVWHYYAMARTPQSILLNSRSPDYINLLEREREIKEKLDSALMLYQENRDTEAINKVLEGIVISLQGDVNNPDYTPDALLNKVLGYLGNLKLSLSKSAKDSIGVTVRVKRTKGFFDPPVESAGVLAKYLMMDIDGNVISSSIRCKTNDKGRFRFTNTNPYTLRDGDVIFSIQLDYTIIQQIEEVAPDGFLDSFFALIEKKKITYSYHDKGRYSPNDLLFVLALYDIDGNQVISESFETGLTSYLSTAKAPEYALINIGGDEFEDIYYAVTEQYPSYRYLAIMRVGIVDFKEYQAEIYVRTDARVVIVNARSGEEVAVQDSYMVGSGGNYESALDNAFEKEARIIAGRLLEVL